jgi:hypothetical protein
LPLAANSGASGNASPFKKAVLGCCAKTAAENNKIIVVKISFLKLNKGM